MTRFFLPFLSVFLLSRPCYSVSISPTTPKRWGPVTLSFVGPWTNERAGTNPFFRYRLDVRFTHLSSSAKLVVPGYYAADGNAAHTSAAVGNTWQVKFAPPRVGDWKFQASFRTGAGIALRQLPASSDGQPWHLSVGDGVHFDGESGEFFVREQTASEPDLRALGRLQYVGQRYFRFAGGKYFLKLGTNSPENLLSFTDFDGEDSILDYSGHLRDWNEGDPTWGDGRGKGLIGAINYLAAMRVNSLFALTLTVRGDSNPQVHPYVDSQERYRFDVSKLDQWRIVFEHAQRMGITVHLSLCETENEALFEFEEDLSVRSGFASSRKIYYREIIARFGHLVGLKITLGEENGWDEGEKNGGGFEWGKGNTPHQRRMFTKYIRALDPYNVPILVHTFPELKEEVYGPMLGPDSGARIEGASLQFAFRASVHRETLHWVSRSADAGKPWVVSADEFGRSPGEPPGTGGVPLVLDGDLDRDYRTSFAWANIMAGGGGMELFSASVDQSQQNFRSYESAWREFSRPITLFQQFNLPFWTMTPWTWRVKTETSDSGRIFKLGKENDIYVIYREAPMSVEMDVSGLSGKFEIRWFDPRKYREDKLLIGSVSTVPLGEDERVDLGKAPFDDWSDWVIIVARNFPIAPRTESLQIASPRDLIPGSLRLGKTGASQWEAPLQ